VRFVLTITWPEPFVRVERIEVDAVDAADALQSALSHPAPPGSQRALRPLRETNYDFHPSVPGDFDELAALTL
jgi:hypothetical protein